MDQAVESKKQLVYEDENILAYTLTGSGPFLVVTFDDAVGCEDWSTFFAEKMLAKKGTPAIGFVAKTDNYYPPQSVHKAYNQLKDFLGQYEEVVMYGGSMGGYASLKYSRLMNASLIIAMCPQWSINPKDFHGVPYRAAERFKDYMGDMKVTKEDLQGQLVIFMDKYYKLDLVQTQAIQKIADDVTIYYVPFIEHHMTPIMAASRGFYKIKDIVTSTRDPLAIHKIIWPAKKASKFYINRLMLVYMSRRHASIRKTIYLLFKYNKDRAAYVYVFFWALFKIIKRSYGYVIGAAALILLARWAMGQN